MIFYDRLDTVGVLQQSDVLDEEPEASVIKPFLLVLQLVYVQGTLTEGESSILLTSMFGLIFLNGE